MGFVASWRHAACLRLADQQERQYAGCRVEMRLRISDRFSQGFQTHHRYYPWPSPAQFIFFSLSNLTEHIRILTIWTIRHKFPPSTHGAYCKNYVAMADYLSQQHIHYTNHMEKIMSTFKLHTVASAPAGSIPILDAANKSLGFIPNLYAHLAESPATLQAYKQLGTLLEQSAFTPEEQQVILVAVSVENRCAYCVAAHSFIARNMVKIPADTITALRSGGTLLNGKLNALTAFTRAVVRERG